MNDGGTPTTPARLPDEGHGNPGPAAPAFRERLTPTFGVWAAAALVALLFGIAALRMGIAGSIITFIVFLGIEAGLLVLGAPTIQVDADLFVAAGARIPVSLLGEAEVLDPDQWRSAIGPDLDARAFLCIRGWIKQGVRVHLVDPQDPTPYWVVSSRRPNDLVAALDTVRRHP